MKALLIIAAIVTASCAHRHKANCHTTVGQYTGDKTTWCDGRLVKYEASSKL